jgi:Bacterial SH3 domain
LVLWEKSLSNSGDKPALARAPSIPTQQAKVSETAATTKTVSAAVEKKGSAAGATPVGKEFRIKYPTSLRKYPNFSSDSLATFTIGTKLMVVGKQGEWLEVQSANNGPRGFIRQEFVVPVEVARR